MLRKTTVARLTLSKSSPANVAVKNKPDADTMAVTTRKTATGVNSNQSKYHPLGKPNL
jgi:hypothetical protein